MVDINPRKHGKFLPGTGQVVSPPEALLDHPVDKILAMNPIYVDEIRAMLRRLEVSAEVLPVS